MLSIECVVYSHAVLDVNLGSQTAYEPFHAGLIRE